ncbi:hypothetical protein [Klebsiella sp. BIGb0407]|uniref:hypothetical protein n=1 Tax=Klebsiella sp. BIGb0407 TaxID=2940603 RepID=UPI002169F3DB|nr:hypothetical protein [Klebsiella sp. BIGb0407]MCS3432189.1 hypothetical protein [Klebsiella sp. BIGb0407]
MLATFLKNKAETYRYEPDNIAKAIIAEKNQADDSGRNNSVIAEIRILAATRIKIKDTCTNKTYLCMKASPVIEPSRRLINLKNNSKT